MCRFAFRAVLVFGVAVVASLPLAGAEPPDLDPTIRKEMAKRQIPGLSLAIVRDGKVELARGYGMADLELSVPARPGTVYEIGSITKQFTAAAVMQLVEEGRIALDGKITKLVPGLPGAWDGVTVRHLLTHTSGIKSTTSIPGFQKNLRKDYPQEEVIKLVADYPLQFKPGERWEYSNTGYFVLGMLLEKVGGKAYGELLRERIFAPLGMSSTRANDLSAVIPNRAAGYTLEKDGLHNADYLSMTQPFAAGVLVSTVEDLARWDAALQGEKVLKAASKQEVFSPARLNDGSATTYGFGWSFGTISGHRVIGHGGGIPGFSSSLARFVDDGVTIIVLMNTDSASADAVLRGVASLVIPGVTAIDPPIADKDAKTSSRLEALFLAVVKDKADLAEFTPETAKALFPERMKPIREFLAGQGAVTSFRLVEETENGGLRVRRYRVEMEKISLFVLFTLAKDGKVAGLAVHPD